MTRILFIAFSTLFSAVALADRAPRTTLGEYVDYNHHYMSQGVILCQDMTLENATVTLNMNTHRISWKGVDHLDTYTISKLDVNDILGNGELAINIVADLTSTDLGTYVSGQLQIISSSAVDSSDNSRTTTWDAAAKGFLKGAKYTTFLASSHLKCKNR